MKSNIFKNKPKITSVPKTKYGTFRTYYYNIKNIEKGTYEFNFDYIVKKLSKLFRPKRKKYGHNPVLIKRDEEILINYVILREADIIPEERILILSEEYELSKSYIKDIVQGKTKRKKLLG